MKFLKNYWYFLKQIMLWKNFPSWTDEENSIIYSHYTKAEEMIDKHLKEINDVD